MDDEANRNGEKDSCLYAAVLVFLCRYTIHSKRRQIIGTKKNNDVIVHKTSICINKHTHTLTESLWLVNQIFTIYYYVYSLKNPSSSLCNIFFFFLFNNFIELFIWTIDFFVFSRIVHCFIVIMAFYIFLN